TGAGADQVRASRQPANRKDARHRNPCFVARPRRRGHRMTRRREFIRMLGGAAAAWPLLAHAQQGERMRRVGVLTGIGDDERAQAPFAVFVQALAQLGGSDGSNVRIDYRWGGGDIDKTRKHATELAASAPDVIFATGTPAVEQLLKATRAVPIVFAFTPDPVGAGLVESLSRPGGNITRFLQ